MNICSLFYTSLFTSSFLKICAINVFMNTRFLYNINLIYNIIYTYIHVNLRYKVTEGMKPL